MYDFKKIGINEIEIIKELFTGVFTIEPWNDDWSDKEQLNLYLLDLIGQNNSLTYGLFDSDNLIGVSMGHIKHWYSGTEYYIEELCIQTDKQGNGIGTYFLKEIEDNLANPALSAGRIASDLGIHRTTFTRIFKAKTGGLSPGNYLREARINHAMKLLKDTVMPLKEIAMECGFANSAYLCRIIMERTGYTPEMFRKQKQDQ